MGFGSCTSKSVLFVLGFIFLVCAAALWGIGGYVIASYQHYDSFIDSKMTLIPAVAAIGVGVVFFFASLLGCCGSENRCTLTLFGVFLAALLGLMTAGAVVSQLYKGDILSSVSKSGLASLNAYADNNDTRDQVDFVQKKWQCCGINNYTDWETAKPWKTDHPDAAPKSCCAVANCTTEGGAIPIQFNNTELFNDGCLGKIVNIFDGNLQYVLGTLVGFAILLVLGIVCSCVLCCIKRQEHVPYFSLN